MCVYGHMSKKSNYLKKKKNNNLLLSAKPEIVVSDSGISFSKFPVSCHLFYDELLSFSTFFALNFDKKLAVE